jgi:hypothetical protein
VEASRYSAFPADFDRWLRPDNGVDLGLSDEN